MRVTQIEVPDIGDYRNIPVIEILVEIGQRVEKEQSLVMLESDKATMDVPSPAAGVIKELKIKLGDLVSLGTPIVLIEEEDDGAAVLAPSPAEAKREVVSSDAPAAAKREVVSLDAPAAANSEVTSSNAPAGANSEIMPPDTPVASSRVPEQPSALAQIPAVPTDEGGVFRRSHASPSVRKFAREVGVEVSRLQGTGPKGRITQADVTAFVKGVMTAPAASSAAAAAGGTGAGLDLLPWPKIDFTKFGPIDPQPLSRIKKISGANLHRNWVTIPHVTNNDEADITELEALRVTLNKENEKTGVKFTILAFVIKAVVAALKKFPTFNASLDGDTLVLKQYYHIGFAADTPNGLVVPVIRDADKKGLLQIAQEMAELSKLAREGKLKGEQMQGGCFSISSLGGIGGTHFTPIINAPEVAILGLSRSAMKAVWDGNQFVPRLIMPISLSFDHRALDGAEAGRFNAYLASLLADCRRILL